MALSGFVCGGPVGANASTLTIPITADVARTDPALGASLVLIFYQFSYLASAIFTSVTDDASVEDDYSLCLFADGLNHYGIAQEPLFSLIVNPLLNGVHSITINLDSTPDWIEAVAVAVTGVGDATSWPSSPFDPAIETWLSNVVLDTAEAPVTGPSSFSTGLGFSQDSFGGVNFSAPTAASDTDWAWVAGDLAYYFVQQVGFGDDPIGWTWTDGAMTEEATWSLETLPGRFQAFSLASSPVVPAVAGPSVAGVWDNGSFIATGGGIALGSGAGPAVCIAPPVTGVPVFSHHHRTVAGELLDA